MASRNRIILKQGRSNDTFKTSFSELKPIVHVLRKGLNELPSHVYEIDWDVIIVGGPRGDWAGSSPF
uniref:Uncharacterized protein n=1 Tax=Cannabis sativa TaxID=3483 RepID=A0A803NQU9_CANSA